VTARDGVLREEQVIHATRRAAVLLLVLVSVAAGCSRGGAKDPTEKGMLSRANNWGRYGVTHSFTTGVKKVQKGTWKCTANVDKKSKTVTTNCTGKSTDGKNIGFHSVSTFDELRKGKTRQLPGKIAISVNGVTKDTPSCVGPACPAKKTG